MFGLVPWSRRGLLRHESDPFDWGHWLPREFEEFFNRVWPSFPELLGVRADVRENETEYVIEAEVPGLAKEAIEIEAREDGTIIVKGERTEQLEEKKENYLRKERRTGSFSRAFYLGENADVEATKASCKDGVLRVVVPKKKIEKAGGKRIEIN